VRDPRVGSASREEDLGVVAKRECLGFVRSLELLS